MNAQPLVQAMQQLGMPLYGCQPPTGYSMTADAWVNTGALLNRMNFAVQLWRADSRGAWAAAGRNSAAAGTAGSGWAAGSAGTPQPTRSAGGSSAERARVRAAVPGSHRRQMARRRSSSTCRRSRPTRAKRRAKR